MREQPQVSQDWGSFEIGTLKSRLIELRPAPSAGIECICTAAGFCAPCVHVVCQFIYDLWQVQRGHHAHADSLVMHSGNLCLQEACKEDWVEVEHDTNLEKDCHFSQSFSRAMSVRLRKVQLSYTYAMGTNAMAYSDMAPWATIDRAKVRP